MKHIALWCITICLFFVPSRVWAQNDASPYAATEHIQAYDVSSTIASDGSVRVAERLEYVFSEPKHGILRVIPYRKTNSNGKTYRMTIGDISVRDDKDFSLPYATSDNGQSLTLKIGDPNVKITGIQRYAISYTVRGALTYFPDHDEWYWNDIGTEWPAGITFGRATITLPANVPDADIAIACFTGALGVRGKNCTASVHNHTAVVQTTHALAAGEGLTTVVGFPKHVVAVLEPTEVVPFFSTVLGKIVIVLIAIAALFWYIVAPVIVVRKWWTGGRDPKPPMGEVRAWFSPPKTQGGRELTPAETGGLIDETVHMRDIYASIIDLARRGFIKITEVSKGIFTLTKVRQWDARMVQPFEQTLLEGIFADHDTAKLKDIDLTATTQKVTGMLYTSLVTDGFFPKNPQTIRVLYTVLAICSAITFNPILLVVSLTFGLHMPRKTLWGAEQAAVARSLKNFLVSQDKQLAFQAKNQMMFEKLLPYAVAFGVEDIWAARFKDLAMNKPTWYESSTGGYTSTAFARSIGTGYSKSFTYSATYKSSSGFSSGFSSGGGFSGGGGGGGGGGSW